MVGRATTKLRPANPVMNWPEHRVDEKEPVRAWHHELTRRPSRCSSRARWPSARPCEAGSLIAIRRSRSCDLDPLFRVTSARAVGSLSPNSWYNDGHGQKEPVRMVGKRDEAVASVVTGSLLRSVGGAHCAWPCAATSMSASPTTRQVRSSRPSSPRVCLPSWRSHVPISRDFGEDAPQRAMALIVLT